MYFLRASRGGSVDLPSLGRVEAVVLMFFISTLEFLREQYCPGVFFLFPII